IGEACHIIDLMTYFTGSKIVSVNVESLTPSSEKYLSSDNKSIILKYEDGSLCTIEYFAIGSKLYPKEFCEIHFDEKTIILDDYKSIKGFGLNVEPVSSTKSEKGQYEELIEFFNVICSGNRYPIPLWDLEQTTKISFIAGK
ncbi:MAG: oxidoreductase, partial [Clostridiaceae bacterium]|nr:oxidoreductase [Clostridiaceae bacterium]